MRQVLSRQVLGKGMLTAAAASSLLAIATGAAYAHSGAVAEASHSPGVLAGNSVSVPITLPLNVCGNTVGGAAALNPAMGNTCATGDSDGDNDSARRLSPEHAEAFEQYLGERAVRHTLPRQRGEAPRAAAARPEAGHAGHPDEGGYRSLVGEDQQANGGEEECDDRSQPGAEHPAPAPAPVPPVIEEAPSTLPAPVPAPDVVPPADQPPAVPAGDTPAHELPAPVPAPDVVPPADQPPATPAHLLPAPVTLPAPAPMQELAETGAGQAAASAALASALILGGAILYRRSRLA